MSDTGDDYRGDYKQAMDSALNGRIGFYADFDSQRQEEVWRLLSADRDRLLTFARRHAITIGKLEVRKTLKSPQPVYELIAVGPGRAQRARVPRLRALSALSLRLSVDARGRYAVAASASPRIATTSSSSASAIVSGGASMTASIVVAPIGVGQA